MAFTLATKPKPKTLKFVKNPTKEEIKKEIDRGMTRIEYDDGSFFVNMNDEYDSDRVKSAIGVENYKWFHETTGNRNWVLYDPKYFKLEYNSEDKFILRFRTDGYDGTPVSMPINASSFCSMFSWMTLPDNLVFENRFNMDKIIDASMMFAGCVFNDFQPPWDTSYCLFTRYMFFGCRIKDEEWLKNINTQYCINMEYMFAESQINDGVNLDLYTLNAFNMTKMFFNAEFLGKCDLGENFMYPNNAQTQNIFENAVCGALDLTGRPLHEIKAILGSTM